MPVLKQLFGISREIKFELCVTYDEGWQEDIANSITEAMVKITQEIVIKAQNEAAQHANKVLLGELESQSSEILNDFPQSDNTK